MTQTMIIMMRDTKMIKAGPHIVRNPNDLVRMGNILYVGASEYASWQLAHANLLAELRGWTPFVVLQAELDEVNALLPQSGAPA